MVADCSVPDNLVDFLLEQAPHNESKRALRQYYHEQLAPASDVDLFIYGLDEEQAIEKIKHIETKVGHNFPFTNGKVTHKPMGVPLPCPILPVVKELWL